MRTNLMTLLSSLSTGPAECEQGCEFGAATAATEPGVWKVLLRPSTAVRTSVSACVHVCVYARARARVCVSQIYIYTPDYIFKTKFLYFQAGGSHTISAAASSAGGRVKRHIKPHVKRINTKIRWEEPR